MPQYMILLSQSQQSTLRVVRRHLSVRTNKKCASHFQNIGIVSAVFCRHIKTTHPQSAAKDIFFKLKLEVLKTI
jgi:hypothetical protein